MQSIQQESNKIKQYSHEILFLLNKSNLCIQYFFFCFFSDAGNTDYFSLDTPATIEKIQLACATKVKELNID
jgi:hypothetical protein